MAGRRRFDDIRGARRCLVAMSLGISVSVAVTVAVTVAGYTVEASQDLGLRNCRARQACKRPRSAPEGQGVIVLTPYS